jgi:hypothetical protein
MTEGKNWQKVEKTEGNLTTAWRSGSQILLPHDAVESQFGSGESFFKTFEDSLGPLRDNNVKNISEGPSLSYSYENHILKLYKLQIFLLHTAWCIGESNFKLKKLHEVEAKN